MKRTSIVQKTSVRSVGLSSVFQIGDSVQITPKNWALAVQRQLQFFYGQEGNFAKFPIFTREIPQPPISPEPVVMTRFNHSNFIKVNNIVITSVSAASVYHIGSTNFVQADNRIKHIRQIHRDVKVDS